MADFYAILFSYMAHVGQALQVRKRENSFINISKQIKVNSAQALGFPSQHGTDVTAAVLKHWCGRMHLIVAGQRYSFHMRAC